MIGIVVGNGSETSENIAEAWRKRRYEAAFVSKLSDADLVGLFVGSEGLFGVALEITLRLLPKPERFRTVLAAYRSLEAAGDAVAAVVASGLLPGALEIMDHLIIEAAEAAVHADPRTACFYARRALELAVSWAYKHDAALQRGQLIIHGDADTLVPIQQAELVIEKFKEAKVPCELVVKKGAGHGWNVFEDVPKFADWFDKYLAKK